jgi:hypothetical protein
MRNPNKTVGTIRTDDKPNDWDRFDEFGKPISLLATLAEREGYMMESKGSTVNIYVPQEAAKEVINVLNHSDILWDNLVTKKLRDLKTHGMAVLPYRILWETGKIIKSYYANDDNVNYAEKCSYLYEKYFPYAINQMEPTNVPHKYFIHLFFHELCQAINQYSVAKLKDNGDIVWIFRIIGDPTITSGNTQGKDERIRVDLIKFPSRYDDLMSSVYQTLDQFKQGVGKDKFHAKRSANSENKKKACLEHWRDLKRFWTDQCHELECSTIIPQTTQSKKRPSKEAPSQMTQPKATPSEKTLQETHATKLLIEFLIDQVEHKRRQYRRSDIKTLITSLLEPHEDKPIPKVISMAPYYYDESVQGILCGRLPSQKRVRVLFLSERNSKILQKALDLQRRPILSFFGGTVAATSLSSNSEHKIVEYRAWYTKELTTLNRESTVRIPKNFKNRERVEQQIIANMYGSNLSVPETEPVNMLRRVHEQFEGHKKMLREGERGLVDDTRVLYDLLYGRLPSTLIDAHPRGRPTYRTPYI